MTDAINPYSQHFRCMARLLKNPPLNDLFMYLLDEHLMMLRRHVKSPWTLKNCSKIAENAGISRTSTPVLLENLKNLQLITIPDKSDQIFVNSDYLMSIVDLFNSKDNQSDKKAICAAFRNKDFETLKSLGWKEVYDGDEAMLDMGGSFMMFEQQGCRSNITVDAQTSDVMSKHHTCRSNINPVAETSHLMLDHHIFQPIFDQFGSKTDFIRWILDNLTEESAQNNALKLAESIYTPEDSKIDVEISEILKILAQFTADLGVSFKHQPCCLNINGGVVQTSMGDVQTSTEINRKDKQKNKSPQNSSFEQVELEGGGVDEELSDDEQPCLDLTKVEVLDLTEQEEPIFRQSSVTPYFNSQEVDQIVRDIDKAKQNPFWLFLYNFWGYASDYTPEDEDEENLEEDEEDDGCEQSSDFNDPEGKPLSLSDFETCKREAYKRTLSEIKNKKLEDFDDVIDFNPDDLFSEKLLSKIFDWEQIGLSRQEYCVIVSKARIRNIEATKLTSVTHPQNREERRVAIKEGREIMTKLYKAKSSPTLYSQLTRIEKMVADFISCYFKPNPDEEDSSPFIFSGPDILPKDEWRKVKVMLNKYHLSVDDFLEACIEKDGPSEERLPLKRVMFFADGIKFINSKYQETSILDTIEA